MAGRLLGAFVTVGRARQALGGSAPDVTMEPIDAAFIHSKQLEQWCYPPECPFRTERAAMTLKTLYSSGLLAGEHLRVVEPDPAPREFVERLHQPEYLDILRRAQDGEMGVEGLHAGLGTPETPVFRGLYDYALLAAGATRLAGRLAADGEVRVAFNPSGGYHHAFPALAAGFCYVNDVALTCLELAERFDRVAFVDIDVHHCDGVQAAFYDRRDVLTLSFHQDGRTIFPGTGAVEEIGEGSGSGFAVNVPLPPGTYDERYIHAFDEVALPVLRAFDPQMIVLEVGMDCLSGDPLAQLNLTNNAYAEVLERVRDLAVPLAVTGGGGYHPENAARGWALAWAVLTGQAEAEREMSLGLGGVMLESADWQGGLRDRVLAPPPTEQRRAVDETIARTVARVHELVFPIQGL